MDFLKRTIDQITRQLEVLTRSQRIAIGMCAVFVAGSLIWLVQYSAGPELVPLLNQQMTLDELDSGLEELRTQRIEAKAVGDRIYVRPADRNAALLALNRADALPKDTSVGFAELMGDDNPFRPADENKWRRQVALGTELGRILGSGEDVVTARVIIQDKTKRRVGAQQSVHATASVYLKLGRGAAFNRHLVEGVCRFVASAVPGLEPYHVTVVDAATMRAHPLPGPDEELAAGLLDERKQNEKHLTDKILAALQSVPGVLVSVSVDLDARKRQTQTQEYGKPEIKTEETSETSSETGGASGETGVTPNVGVAVNGGMNGERNRTEESRAEYYQSKAVKIENIEHAPFTVARATASIGIPRSFLVGIHHARFGASEEPAKLDETEEFRLIRDAEIARVRSAAMNILMTKDPEDVDVEVFYDFAPEGGELNTFPGGDTMLATASGDGGAMDFFRSYGTQTGLFALALMSFFMMTRLVRKSTDAVKSALPPQPRTPPEDFEDEMLQVSGGPVGQAAASEGLLVAQEVDEDTLRFSQVGEQVSQMVSSDPQAAAELIRRWAETSD